jgi:thiamine monophosphate synthase
MVRGLKPVDGIDDLNVFTNFCEQNLPIKPAVVRCHRVGKIVTGKVQPLLVVLRDADAASELLNCAPRLRKATDENVKHVFINQDLTAAQALAAYQLRVARRTQRQQANVVNQPCLDNAALLSVSAACELSVNATEFIPAPSPVCAVPCV